MVGDRDRISADRRAELIDGYLRRVNELQAVSANLFEAGKVQYPRELTQYRDLLAKLNAKLENSISLNQSLYLEQANVQELDAYYCDLRELFAKFFDRDGDMSDIGIYHDVNMGNYFVDGTFIDSADDVISGQMRTRALLVKEVAKAELDLGPNGPSDPGNIAKLDAILDRIVGKDVTDSQFAELIGFIYLYDFSDSKSALRDMKAETQLASCFISSLNGPGVNDAVRCEQFNGISIAARERQQKNCLILMLLKRYNVAHQKNLDAEIKKFEDRYIKGLFVLDDAPMAFPGRGLKSAA
jgi:hypothetical protein